MRARENLESSENNGERRTEDVLIVENISRAFAKACIFIHRGKILRIIVFRTTKSKDEQKKKKKERKKGWGLTIMTIKKNKRRKRRHFFCCSYSCKIATALSIQTLFFRVNFLKTESFVGAVINLCDYKRGTRENTCDKSCKKLNDKINRETMELRKSDLMCGAEKKSSYDFHI